MMEVLSIEDIIFACKGIGYNCNKSMHIKSICTDSRRIREGDLFIPIRGENFDGHDFIQNAYAGGAAIVLTDRDLEHQNKPYIVVKNTLTALHDIASYYRHKLNIPIVAVTGSSGKTTTKDMIASVLGEKFRVLKTEGNFNNTVGLPLTLLNMESKHEIAVLEMGMSGLGEIEELAAISEPEIGIITNVGTAHIEKLYSRENILKAKMELFTHFDSSKLAIINGDNDLLKDINNKPYKIIKFGLEQYNDLIAENIKDLGEAGIGFEICIKGRLEQFIVPIPGIHNVYNALSAICVGLFYNMSIDDIRNGLNKFKPSKLRMEIFYIDNNIKIINDVYNANPESMIAALNVLSGFKSRGRTICILGDMLELGDFAKEQHRKLGEYASSLDINILIAVGKMSEEILKGAENAGMNSNNLYSYKTNSDVMEHLYKMIKTNDTILIKGSRGMKMESIVEYLRERR